MTKIAKKSAPKGQTSSKRDNAAQSRAFIKKAREIGVDDETSTADELIGQLAKKKPKPRS